MRRYTFLALLVMLAVIAVACQTVLPETPIFQRITTPTQPGRGVSGEMGILVDPTNTPTIEPGFWTYLNPTVENCRTMIKSGAPTALPVWTRTTTGSVLGITDVLLICNTSGSPAEFTLESIGYSQGHSHGGDWELICVGLSDCSASVNIPWTPQPTDVAGCGLAGGYWNVNNQTVDVEQGPFVIAGVEGKNQAKAWFATSSITGFSCTGYSYHGYKILATVVPAENNCTGTCCITEINATQDITPTTSAHMDYNLHAGQGADDEFVEVHCPTPMSMSGWEVTDGTRSYTFAQDNFTWPLKVQWCDEMINCDPATTGFPSSGTWYLYDAAGDLADERAYPTMATPGNSWAANHYATPGGAWSEQKPHPGTHPTNTVTPTPTSTPTATPAP